MVYDAHAKRLGIKAIGTVESDLTYDAINYNDPITVGVVQWYGTRAASILNRMRNENKSAWTGVAGSVTSSLRSYPSSNGGYWTTRWLSTAEGNSLKPVLLANRAIQNDQIVKDFKGYLTVARNLGMREDTNTLSVLFFFTMYHQSPQRGMNVVRAAGAGASLTTLHAAALAEPVLGKYPSRLNQVLAILQSGDASGVDDDDEIPPDPGDQPTPSDPPAGPSTRDVISYVEEQGDLLLIKFAKGERVAAYPNGRGWWVPRAHGDPALPDESDPGEPDPDPDPDPGGGGGGDPGDPKKFICPTQGIFTSGWGSRPPLNPHFGVDIAPPTRGNLNHPIYAAMGGTVRAAKVQTALSNPITGTWNTGSYLVIDCADGTTHFYGHMHSIVVSAGQTVPVGKRLGTTGAYGNVTGVHLHFETWTGRSRSPINPAIIFNRHGVKIGATPSIKIP